MEAMTEWQIPSEGPSFVKRFFSEKNMFIHSIIAVIVAATLILINRMFLNSENAAIIGLFDAAVPFKAVFLHFMKTFIPYFTWLILTPALFTCLVKTGSPAMAFRRVPFYMAFSVLGVVVATLGTFMLSGLDFSAAAGLVGNFEKPETKPLTETLIGNKILWSVFLSFLSAPGLHYACTTLDKKYKIEPASKDSALHRLYIILSSLSAATLWAIKRVVLLLLPFVVFALIGGMVYNGKVDAGTAPLALKVVGAMLFNNLLYCILCTLIIFFFTGPKITAYLLHLSKKVVATAFFTSSTKATLPVTIEQAKKGGVTDWVVDLYMPIGAAIAMGGTATFLVSITLMMNMGVNGEFIASTFGGSVISWFYILLSATLLAMGAAGVPKGGTFFLAPVFAVVNVPLELISFILAIDVLCLDRGRSVVNAFDELMSVTLGAYLEGHFSPKNAQDWHAGKID